MKFLFLCGVAVLGLTGLPAGASAAAIGGAGAAQLLEPAAEQSLLVQVQHRPHGSGGGGHPSRGHGGHGGHGGGGDGAGAAAAGAAIGLFLGTMMAVEAQRQQAINYCMRRFPRSFDPNSMTYVGRDGRRHRCP